jgi:hypothetical protein
MGAAHVAGVARIAAAIEARRRFQNEYLGARAPRADGGAQRRIPAANHQDIEFPRQIDHAIPLATTLPAAHRIPRADNKKRSGHMKRA